MCDTADEMKAQSRCLLHADWMHRLASSNQRGANGGVTKTRLRMLAASKSCISRKLFGG